MDIAGKKIVIIGGRRSGMALARLVTSLNGKAGISEQGPESCLTEEFKGWAFDHDIASEFNGHTQEFIEEGGLVVLSPGVRFDALPVVWARDKGIPVLGEIEFAAQFCAKPIIAVTGSNGKTTVATLIRDILEHGGYKVCLCGNVGFPFSEFVLDLDDKDCVVLETSSFQLESVLDPDSTFRTHPDNGLRVAGFKPHIAVILNFSRNHLDRHKDIQEYLQAKKRIFVNQEPDDFTVLNYHDSQLKGLAPEVRSQVVFFDSPSDDEESTDPNHSAALEVGRILGVNKERCREVFKGFKGVEHRLEKVRDLNGIDFINDSKATTVEAARWALRSIDRPVLMICGGRDKNIDFSLLAGPVRQKVKKIYAIGEARQKIRQAFDALTGFEECEGLEDAVIRARQSASEGDCVLLSPMCASFDMFTDFEHRGRVFKEIVHQLE
ncbi:MAG: hypothetical protein KAJ70_02290 [Candidatus Omnitrophica bacterium]|nr:hypothetical protein [Candidatus Omnitrophota bacterium]